MVNLTSQMPYPRGVRIDRNARLGYIRPLLRLRDRFKRNADLAAGRAAQRGVSERETDFHPPRRFRDIRGRNGHDAGRHGPGSTSSPAPAPRPQRIVIVNIAKVLRDYNKANFLGAEITKKRERMWRGRPSIAPNWRIIKSSTIRPPIRTSRSSLQDKAVAIQRKIDDMDRQAQRELTALSNETIVRVYQEIKGVIYDIAKTNNLDMVLCYPAASRPEDENSPQVAQLMLQTPALIPFYHHGMDITEVVTKTLNARYPSESHRKSREPVRRRLRCHRFRKVLTSDGLGSRGKLG